MPAHPNVAALAAAESAAARQEHIRDSGHPVLTFLTGPAEAAAWWSRYQNAAARPVMECAGLDADETAGRFARLALASPSAQARLAEWLARRAGRAASSIAETLRLGGADERRRVGAQAGLDPALAGYFLSAPYLFVAGPPVPLSKLAAPLHEILAPGLQPAVLVRLDETAPVRGPQAALRQLALGEELLARAPSLRLACALGAELAQRVRAELRGTRLGARVEEGAIACPHGEAAGANAAAGAALEALLSRLPEARRARIVECWQAAACPRDAGPTERADRARSHAERLLLALLEAMPETRGRFELNARLQTRSGLLPVTEVDFLARAEKLAVEVDGYYHFRDTQAYRRDRVKDLVLQQEGYTVARFLAQDVVHAAGPVLDAILCALEHARADQGGK